MFHVNAIDADAAAFCGDERSAQGAIVVSSTGRVRHAALHTYIPIYEAMDSSTTHHS